MAVGLDESPPRNGVVSPNLLQLRLLLAEFQKLRLAIELLSRQDASVDVSNLDEVRGALHTELNSFANKLDALWSKSWGEIAESIRNFKYVVKLPGDVKVTGLELLQGELAQILAAIVDKDYSPVIKVDVPEVKVPRIDLPKIELPDIIVPEARVDLDLSDLLSALEPLKLLSNKATKPLSVRLSDGQHFIKELQAAAKRQERAIQVLSQAGGMTSDEFRTAFLESTTPGTGTSGFKALTDAATAVQVSTTATKLYGMDLCATGGLIAVGDSEVVATSGSERGLILYPGNPPTRYPINRLDKLYAAGATGTRLCYVAYS